MFGLFAEDDVPRERFHKSSKFADVAGLPGAFEVVVGLLPGCSGGDAGDMMEVLIL